MTRLLGTAAAIAILGGGISGSALAQYQAYQPNPYPQTFPQRRAPTAYPSSGTSQPQYGSSSYPYPLARYPLGRAGQQSYELGARAVVSGTVTTPPDVAASSGTTIPNPAYMPSAAQYGTGGGTYVPYGYYGR